MERRERLKHKLQNKQGLNRLKDAMTQSFKKRLGQK